MQTSVRAYISQLLPLLQLSLLMNVIQQVSAIEQEKIEIDPDTKELLDALDFKDIPNLLVAPAARVA
jgi:Ribosomal S17